MEPTPERLERALAVYLAWQEAPEQLSAADLLARHADLADLLEPMLADAAGDDAAADGSLGSYRILRELGRGGMGIVYEAVHARLGRRLALKVLPAQPGMDPARIARFQREARLLARLAHAGIVSVLEVGEDRGQHWLAMELVAGASLAATIAALGARGLKDWDGSDLAAAVAGLLDAPPPPAPATPVARADVVARIGLQLAEALGHAHAHGIVHRDVKPSNVLARPDGSVVLTDFGIALGLDDPGLTLTGAFTGSPRYVSPEQARGERDKVDARSDLFSLGATLYELLALAPAFPGATAADVLAQVQSYDPPDPHRRDRSVPADLAAILSTCLEKDPARRYTSAAALAEDLRAFLDRRPVRVRRSGPSERLRRWIRREPWRASAAALALLGLAAVVSFSAYTVARAPLVAAGEKRARELALRDLIAQAYLWFGTDDRRARAGFDAAIALEPASADAWAGSVMASIALGDSADAARRIEQMRAHGAPSRIVDLMQARLWWREGRRPEAEALRKQVGEPAGHLELFLSGESIARRAMELPVGAIMERERLLYTAISSLDRAILTAPEPLPSYHMVRARAAAQISQESATRGSSEVLQAHWPSSSLAWHAIGLSLRPLRWPKDQEACVAAFRRAIELDPRFGLSLFELGTMFVERGDPEAIPLLERYVQLSPDSAEGQAQLGCALAAAGRIAEALRRAARARELAPASRAVLHQVGRIHAQAGDAGTASSVWREALALEPRVADVATQALHADLIALLLGRDATEARAAAETALEQMGRGDPYLLVLHAQALRACGSPAPALAELDAAAAAVHERDRGKEALRARIAQLRQEWR